MKFRYLFLSFTSSCLFLSPFAYGMDSTNKEEIEFSRLSLKSKSNVQSYDYKDVLGEAYIIKNGENTWEIKREGCFADSYGQEQIEVNDKNVYKKPENAMDLNKIYFDFKERNNWEPSFYNRQIKFVNGIAYFEDKIANHTLGGINTMRYVMGVDGHLYISNQDTGSHSTLINGAYCLCAGDILLNEYGKITFLNNLSGHIVPSTEQFYKACKYLAHIGALSPNCTLSVMEYGEIKRYDSFMKMMSSQVKDFTRYDFTGDFGIPQELWDAQSSEPVNLPSQPLSNYEKFIITYKKMKQSVNHVNGGMSSIATEAKKYSSDENFDQLFPKIQQLTKVYDEIESLKHRISVLRDHPFDRDRSPGEKLKLLAEKENELAVKRTNIPYMDEPWMEYFLINGSLKM